MWWEYRLAAGASSSDDTAGSRERVPIVPIVPARLRHAGQVGAAELTSEPFRPLRPAVRTGAGDVLC